MRARDCDLLVRDRAGYVYAFCRTGAFFSSYSLGKERVKYERYFLSLLLECEVRSGDVERGLESINRLLIAKSWKFVGLFTPVL